MPAFTTLTQRNRKQKSAEGQGRNRKRRGPWLPHLLVKKATRGKAGSWESVKTFWTKRFGRQLCCGEKRPTPYQTSATLGNLQKDLTLKKRPTFPSLLASRMLTSVSVNTLFKVFGFFFSIWQPLGLQTPALGAPAVVWAGVGAADVAPGHAAGCRPPGDPS